LIDSDVIINWLSQETETITGNPLWMAPAAILELGERKLILNHVSLCSFLEIRYVLRRKEKRDARQINSDLRAFESIVYRLTPDEEELHEADRLQEEHALDPFDSILLAQAVRKQTSLISRDLKFVNIASHYVPAMTPEQYILGVIGKPEE
jgi:PIN domain nuclease of toxin-antitoxin system